MELSKYLRDYSKTVAGKEQLIIAAVARALEVIPRQLCDNAGFDSMNILNRLRQKHAEGSAEGSTVGSEGSSSSLGSEGSSSPGSPQGYAPPNKVFLKGTHVLKWWSAAMVTSHFEDRASLIRLH